MTDNDSFNHFMKKCYEILHLHFRHYLPVGKPEPLLYREFFFELYKIYDSGVLEELSQEPILEEEVKQLDFLSAFFSDQPDILTKNGNGPLFDKEEVKTT